MELECRDGKKGNRYNTLTELLLFSNMSTVTRWKQKVKQMCRGTHQVKKAKNCNVHRSFSFLLV